MRLLVEHHPSVDGPLLTCVNGVYFVSRSHIALANMHNYRGVSDSSLPKKNHGCDAIDANCVHISASMCMRS